MPRRTRETQSWPLVEVRAVFRQHGEPETRQLPLSAWRKARYQGRVIAEVAAWDGWLMTDPDTIRRAVAAGVPREADEDYTPTARSAASNARNYADGL